MKQYLCMDIGGTAIKYGMLDENGNILSRNEIATPTDKDSFWDSLYGIVELQKKNCEQEDGQLAGIAVSLPGKVDSNRGYVYTGGCLEYLCETEFAKILQEETGIPVTVENDGVCAALAEMKFGSLQGCKDAIIVVFGTGIGGAIIENGVVRKGHNNSAAEFSFLIMGAGFYQEETLWASDNGDYHLRSLVSEYKKIPIEQLDGKKIFEMAGTGDEIVLEVLRCYTKIIARNLYNLQAILDVEKIAVGGGISEQPIFIELIKENLEEYQKCVNSPIVLPKIVKCRFGKDANLVGALVHLKETIIVSL